MTYKVAVTLDGRVRVPGSRWVTGEDSRRLVHVLRAQSDAVAVGMGTVRWDNPRLDARDVPVVEQPRRIAFGQWPAARRLGARAPLGAAARGARGARRRRRPVGAPRGRADARRGVPRGRARGQAARLRRAAASPATGQGCSTGCRARSSSRAWRRGRSARTSSSRRTSTSPSTLADLRPCSRGSCASSASSSRPRRRAAGGLWSYARPRPPPARSVGDSVAIDGCCLTATAVADGTIRVPRGARDDRAHDARRRSSAGDAGQRRAGAPRRRGARRALRPGTRRRGRSGPVGRGRGGGAPCRRRGARRLSCATASRRARSPSTACR